MNGIKKISNILSLSLFYYGINKVQFNLFQFWIEWVLRVGEEYGWVEV